MSLSPIYHYSKKHGYSFDHEFVNINGWLVQFVETSHNPLRQEALDQAELIKIGGYDCPVIDREHLVAMWLFAGRAKDFQKIALFWDAGLLDNNKLQKILLQHDLMLKWQKEKGRFTDE